MHFIIPAIDKQPKLLFLMAAIEKTIPQIIEIAKICQVLATIDKAKQNAFKGGFLDERLPKMLYMERMAVEFTYNYNPSNPDLRFMANYLWGLCWGYAGQAETILNNLSQTAPVITNPANQSVNVGQNATFSVTVTSSLPYTIQWYDYSGSPIVGATGLSYTLLNAQLTDSGHTFYAIATNAAGSATSATATLTVTAAITGSYYYGNTNYYAILNGGSDPITYNGTFSITNGNPLVVNFGSGYNVPYYNVVKYPSSQSDKTIWSNTVLNNGSIPDSVYHSIITFGGNKYLVTRNTMALDSTSQTVTYS